MRAAVGKSVFFAPNFHPSTGTDITPVDGLLNWMPSTGVISVPVDGWKFGAKKTDFPTAARIAATSIPVFFAPNFHPSTGTDITPVDGLLNWMAWPNNGNNLLQHPFHHQRTMKRIPCHRREVVQAC
jgi:hypothetical protein